MSLIDVVVALILVGFCYPFFINLRVGLRQGIIFSRITQVKRSKKPFTFWLIWIGSLLIMLFLLYKAIMMLFF